MLNKDVFVLKNELVHRMYTKPKIFDIMLFLKNEKINLNQNYLAQNALYLVFK